MNLYNLNKYRIARQDELAAKDRVRAAKPDNEAYRHLYQELTSGKAGRMSKEVQQQLMALRLASYGKLRDLMAATSSPSIGVSDEKQIQYDTPVFAKELTIACAGLFEIRRHEHPRRPDLPGLALYMIIEQSGTLDLIADSNLDPNQLTREVFENEFIEAAQQEAALVTIHNAAGVELGEIPDLGKLGN